MQAVSSVGLGAKWPTEIPLAMLQQHRPCLKSIRFKIPFGSVTGSIKRNSAQVFTEMAIYIPRLVESSAAVLSAPGYGLTGSNPKYRLVGLRVGQHPSLDPSTTTLAPLLPTIGLTDGSGVNWLDETAQQILQPVRYMSIYRGTLSLDNFEKIVSYTPQLVSLSISVAWGGHGKEEEEADGKVRIKHFLPTSCPSLRHLYLLWDEYSHHADISSSWRLSPRTTQSHGVQTSLDEDLAEAKQRTLSQCLNAGIEPYFPPAAHSSASIEHWDIGFHAKGQKLVNPAVFAFALLQAVGIGSHINLWVIKSSCHADYVNIRQAWCRDVLDFRATIIHNHASRNGPGWKTLPKSPMKVADRRDSRAATIANEADRQT